jgi:hypothetical protein
MHRRPFLQNGEFLCWESVQAAMRVGFDFILANRGCKPVFDVDNWQRPFKHQQVEYNSCIYQAGGWGCACRFVAMRIAKKTRTPFKPTPAVHAV